MLSENIKKLRQLLLTLCIPLKPGSCVLNRFCCVCVFVTLWTLARQAPLSMGFSKQAYWSGLPCPPPADLPHPGMEPASLTSPALAGRFVSTNATWEASISFQLLNKYIRQMQTQESVLGDLLTEAANSQVCCLLCFMYLKVEEQ